MAKKTKADILKCPIDYLYLWASDEFISALGSKAKIIKQKKNNQYQSLYKTITENEKADSSAEYMEYYKQWTSDIAAAIKSTYNLTPAEILTNLALGKDVVGKNWSKGVYGIGEVPSISFVQNSDYQVNPNTGMIMAGDGVTVMDKLHQTPIYGQNGEVTGYSYTAAGKQYQSTYSNGQFVALSYSDADGVQTANGGTFDSSKASFWQNANNYMPMIEKILSWLTSFVNSFFPDRTVLTTKNTVPDQTEWVEYKRDKESATDGNSLLIFGGLLAAGLFLGSKGSKGSKKKNKK